MQTWRTRGIWCSDFVRLEDHSPNADRLSWLWRIIDRSVPSLSSLWFGIGTVIVEFSVRRCIMMWLPLCRTLEKPCLSRIRQASSPESSGNLANAHL